MVEAFLHYKCLILTPKSCYKILGMIYIIIGQKGVNRNNYPLFGLFYGVRDISTSKHRATIIRIFDGTLIAQPSGFFHWAILLINRLT